MRSRKQKPVSNAIDQPRLSKESVGERTYGGGNDRAIWPAPI